MNFPNLSFKILIDFCFCSSSNSVSSTLFLSTSDPLKSEADCNIADGGTFVRPLCISLFSNSSVSEKNQIYFKILLSKYISKYYLNKCIIS